MLLSRLLASARAFRRVSLPGRSLSRSLSSVLSLSLSLSLTLLVVCSFVRSTGPLEELLARGSSLSLAQQKSLSLVHRNGLRLLKLVNVLLNFSRIEAGRVQATYRPTDLASLTAELASVFRAAFERANVRLLVRCDHA